MDLALLNEAFENFTRASESLERYYRQLQQKVVYLTEQLEEKNRELISALQEVKQHRDLLMAVLNNLEEAVMVVDDGGNVILMNPSAKRILEIEKEEEGLSLNELGVSIDTMTGEGTLRVNGRSYHVMLSRSPLRWNGLKDAEVILIRDITRQKEMEVHYERNKRLISMGEMAVKIAHEIRNPLCSMELFASMLKREVSEDRQKGLVEGILKGIRSLENILANMLLFTKNHTVRWRAIEMRRFLSDMVGILRPLAESKGICLKEDVSVQMIWADPDLLKQALMNILINGIQAEPEGGEVVIRAEEKAGYAVISIKDNGPGIDDQHIERIFDPFFTTKQKGTGLGLTIAERIIQAHGGVIRVSTGSGKGSIFSLWIPQERER